ncbi:AMP-binding protein [Paractinoplanes hotanensis]|uniref:AMP-binding protein n=1 Tax=Paractinoplanes hotanensis TaxID=2906497 RepID=A0ABT0Y2H0_9ACTN|nr:AMP-binding protein [Actinoplanes hotanensis]MCM4080228.1 AMP-binding protein [Actinoplanes hotanensis]
MSGAAFVLRTMARRGLLNPGAPQRVVRQLSALHTWGFGLAGELRQATARDPGRVALIDEQGSLTYAELLDRSSRLAAALPVQPRDRVGLLCRNSAEMVVALIGIATRGADPVLINTGLSGPQLADVVRDQSLAVLIHDDEFPAPPGVRAFPTASGALAAAAGVTEPPVRPGRTIVLTSGTTGAPKGAQRPTPGGFRPLCSIIDRIPLHAGVRMHIAGPLFHTWAYAGLQMALALRATLVLRRRFDPAQTLETVARHDCSALIAVPVMLQQIMEQPYRPVPLRVVAVSGSALPGGLAGRFMDRYGDILYNLYGSTEASWASIATPADMRAAPGTAGRPPYGTKVVALGEDGRPAPTGTTGRLFVGNEMLFEGYTNGAAQERRDGLLAIGDVGHLDRAGRVFVDGRQDDMIVSGGENVFPAEVENLLADLPQVLEVAVVGVADDKYGQRLAAYVVLREGAALTTDDVRDHVRRHRARFSVPRDVVFLPELPRNATGKVLKRSLPQP